MERYVVNGCKEVVLDGEKFISSIPAKSVDAEFWGVYFVEDDGTQTWVADYPTLAEAREFAQLKINEGGDVGVTKLF